MKKVICILIAALFLASSAHAEIFNCGGKWTNKPCEAEPKATLKEKPSQNNEKEVADRSERESLLHELKMQAIEARRKYDVRIDVSAVETLCMKPQSSLSDCKNEVDALSDRIDQRTQSAALIKAREQSNKLKEKDLEIKQKEVEDNNTIVIVEERNIIIPHHRRPPIRPLSGAGISVNVNSADGSISAGGSVFSGSGIHPRPHHHDAPLGIQRPSQLKKRRNAPLSIQRPSELRNRRGRERRR